MFCLFCAIALKGDMNTVRMGLSCNYCIPLLLTHLQELTISIPNAEESIEKTVNSLDLSHINCMLVSLCHFLQRTDGDDIFTVGLSWRTITL